MAEPLCHREDFHLYPPLPYSLTPTRRYVDYANQSNHHSHSPDSMASSGTSSTEYSMIGRSAGTRGGTQSARYATAKSVNVCRSPGDSGLFTMRTYQLLDPLLLTEDGLRSKSLEPSPYNTLKQHRVTAAPFITNSFVRARPYQHPRVAFCTPESDYETPEKIWQREQRKAASFQRSESARVSRKSYHYLNRSSSNGARAHSDKDVTPKASPGAPEDSMPKASFFGVRRRLTGLTAPVRVKLLAPTCQRKRIQPMNIEDGDSESDDDSDVKVETKPTTLAEIVLKRSGVYETEESKMAGPSSLLQALKEVKHAEKEQLGSASQTGPQRITLFDLIIEKDRRHRTRSPPPVPPKPHRRILSFSESSSVKKNESSMPKTVDALKPLNLFQALPNPPPLPTPPKCVLLRTPFDTSAVASKTSTAGAKVVGDQKVLTASNLPISENPFVQWDRIGSYSHHKTNNQISNSPETFANDVRPERASTSPCSSGVGTEGFDEDGPATATISVSSTGSVHTSNSSPSPDWPKPEKITARPQSHQCSPDPFDDRAVQEGSTKKCVEENGEAHSHQDRGPIRVSLIAAPKRNVLCFDTNLPDTASDTSTSSRTSTIFSYPWDLPPLHSGQSSSSNTTSPFPLRWATLQHHLSQVESHSPSQHSTLKSAPVKTKNTVDERFGNCECKERASSLFEVKSKDENSLHIERKDDDKTSSDDELLLDMFAGDVKILKDESFSKEVKVNQGKQFRREEEPYDMIGDDSGAEDRIMEGVSSKEVPSPSMESSTATSTDLSHNQCPQQYIYAEVKPSSDTSTSSSFAIHTPSVPSHPSESKLIVNEINPYEEIDNSENQLKSSDIKPEIPSSTDSSSHSNDPGDRRSESRPVSTQSGEHLELFVCGLLNDKHSSFCKYVTTFIGCTIKQLGKTPRKTLQNVRQFMDGVTRFLQNSHEKELQQAIKAEERELRGLQYFDVARELEGLIQLSVLRPLHRRLIENLHCHGCGTVLPKVAEEFADLVKKEYYNLGEAERQRMENHLVIPVKRIFAQLIDAFQPGSKLEHLVRVFRYIDSQVHDNPEHSKHSQDMTKLMIYAVIFALADLLKPPKRISPEMCHQTDGSEKCAISRIEVQRLYLEALISPACLASSAEGCRRLTDLVCLLRYVNNFQRYGTPVDLVPFICRHQKQSNETDESFQSPKFHKCQRSLTDNIQEVLQRHSNAQLWTGSSTPSSKDSTRSMNESGRILIKPGSTPFSHSSFIVLAMDESKKVLVPYEISLRWSLTVRELCNMLALKMSVFDSKDFALFFHSPTGDIPMSDTLHLEPFLTQYFDEGSQAAFDDSALSVHFGGGIEYMSRGASQPPTPKMSALKRFLGRQKPFIRTYSSLEYLESTRETSKSLQQSHPKDSQREERRPSIDWGSLGKRHLKFVLVYRRRSSEAVLYASDLFDCLPNVGKLI